MLVLLVAIYNGKGECVFLYCGTYKKLAYNVRISTSPACANMLLLILCPPPPRPMSFLPSSMSPLHSSHVPLPQAKEKTAQEQQQHVQEQDDNYTELYNHIHGDMLTENPGVAQSAFGPTRVITDRWKGMSPGQVQEIRDTQEMQLKEKEVCVCVSVCVCVRVCMGVGVCVWACVSVCG